MASLFQWFLHVHVIFLAAIYPSWTLHIDIMSHTNKSDDCSDPVVCNWQYGNSSSPTTVQWVMYTRDVFAVTKTVRSMKGRIVLQTSVSSCRLSYFYTNRTINGDYKLRCLNCSELLTKDRRVFIQNVLTSTIDTLQYVLNSINLKNTYSDTIVRPVNLLISRSQWTNYIMFATTNDELSLLSSSIQNVTQMMYVLDEITNVNRTLAALYTVLKEEDLNFIVVCSSDCIKNFLQQANLLEPDLKKRSRWLIVPAGNRAEDILSDAISMKTTDVVILDIFRCSQHFPTFELGDLVHQPCKPNNMPYTDTEQYDGKTRQEDSSVTAHIYIMLETENGTSLLKRGTVRQDDEIVLTHDVFPGNKYGFNNNTFTVTLLEWPPFVSKKELHGSVFYSGICLELLKELAHDLNFSYQLVEPEDQEFGRLRNGQWTGMVSSLITQKADLILGPLAMDASREKTIDFTVPYFFDNSAVIFRKQDPNTNKWRTLVSTFRYEVYICIFVSLVFSTALVFVVEEISLANTRQDNRLSARRIRCGNILWYHFGALMANGGAYVPKTQAGRSILGCWWLFTVICAATYSGNLIAFLTDWREKPPFTKLSEMVNQDTYRWGTLGGSNYINLFQGSNRSEYKKIWQGITSEVIKDPEVLSIDIDVHLRKVLTGSYAYISDVTNLEMWRNEHCELQLLKEVFSLINLAIALPNNSIHTEVFSKQILKITESGLMDMWYKQWMPRSYCETSKSARRVELLALQSAFYTAGLGVFLGLFVLIAEVVYHRKYN